MKSLRTIAVAACVIFAFGQPARAFHEGDHGGGPIDRTFKIGKTGEVNIGRDVKIGTQFVKRGKYMLAHRQENQRHVFVFTEISKKKDASQLTTIEVDGMFISSSGLVKKSAVMAKEQRDHSYEVQKIQIAGENGDHVFSRSVGGPAK